MLFQEFLTANSLKTFEDVKSHFENHDVLNIKEHPELPLYMVFFKTNPTTPMERECNGTIYEKDSNRLVHHCFNHAYDNFQNHAEDNYYNINQMNDFDGVVYEKHLLDGSLVRVYHYEGEWRFATSRHLDPAQNFWNKNNFMDLIHESIRNYTFMEPEAFLSTLDSNYCYTYCMMHPKNRNVYFPEPTPLFMLSSKVDLENETEEYDSTVHGDHRVDNLVERVYGIQNNPTAPLHENSMFFFVKNGVVVDRVKCMNPNYIYAKSLRGNHPDLRFRYLELLGTPEIQHFIGLFPEFTQLFQETHRILEQTALDIHKMYMNQKVFKTEQEVPKKYEKSIYFLHGKYLKTREKVTKDDSLNALVNLGKKNSKHLAWIIGLI